MSSSIALRRSPKPGALTAAIFRPPRSLLTTSVASASPSTSSATMSSGLPVCMTASRIGSSGCSERELLLVDENVGIVEFGDHLLGVGDEIGREIAAIELHAFDDVGLGLEALGLFDRDHAFIADLLHRLGDFFADEAVAIGRDRADLGDLVVRGDLLRVLLEIGDDGLDGEIDAALQIHRVEAGGDGLRAFAGDRSGEHGGGRRAVAGEVVRLGGDFADELGAEIFELVGKLDLLGDGDAVLADARRAEGLFDNDVAALGAERDFDGVVEDFDAAHNAVARVGGETDVFCSHLQFS